jgi:hypothetical protein
MTLNFQVNILFYNLKKSMMIIGVIFNDYLNAQNLKKNIKKLKKNSDIPPLA